MILDLIMLGLGVLLTGGTAVFVAAEFSLVALDPATVDDKANKGDARAKKVAQALHNLSLQLSSCQVGITMTTILLGYVAQKPLQELFTRLLTNANIAYSAALATGIILAFIIVNLFSMVFGELVPKNMALADPLHSAAIVSLPLRIFTIIFKPVVAGLNNAANGILKLFGIEAAEELSGARSASELSALVRRSAEQGTLDVSTARLLTRSIDIGALTAVDVMTDRGRVEYVTADQTAADVVDLARKTGYSRFPVIGEDFDDVQGTVNLRRAIAIPYDKRGEVSVTSSSLMVPVLRVPETLELAPLLVALRASGSQVAMVIDEYGGLSGLATLEDVIEEIVGDVADEHDHSGARSRVLATGETVVSGLMRPDEISREFHIDIPDDGPWETLGGWIMAGLGKIPEVGDEYSAGSVHARVEKMDGRRIETVRLTHQDDAEEAE